MIFNDKQKQFLIDKLNNGIVCVHEEEPENVSGALQFSTNPDNADGSKMFRMEDFFALKQIMSFFSRHASTSDAARELVISDLRQSFQ